MGARLAPPSVRAFALAICAAAIAAGASSLAAVRSADEADRLERGTRVIQEVAGAVEGFETALPGRAQAAFLDSQAWRDFAESLGFSGNEPRLTGVRAEPCQDGGLGTYARYFEDVPVDLPDVTSPEARALAESVGRARAFVSRDDELRPVDLRFTALGGSWRVQAVFEFDAGRAPNLRQARERTTFELTESRASFSASLPSTRVPLRWFEGRSLPGPALDELGLAPVAGLAPGKALETVEVRRQAVSARAWALGVCALCAAVVGAFCLAALLRCMIGLVVRLEAWSDRVNAPFQSTLRWNLAAALGAALCIAFPYALTRGWLGAIRPPAWDAAGALGPLLGVTVAMDLALAYVAYRLVTALRRNRRET